jgi:elongation factor 1 alpha-like protein
MSKYDYDDYDDGYDDGYEETMEYVKKVKAQLKLPKVTDAQIIRKLEDTDYSIDKTVKFFKDKETKVQAKVPQAQAKAAPTNVKPVLHTSKGATKATEAMKVTNKLSSMALDQTAGSVETNTVFHAVRGEILLSDDEDVVVAKATGPIAAGKPSQEDTLQQLTMVVTGHVDAGKSTLVGHLLYKCGQVAQRTMHKYEKDSKSIGKASFALAWVTDDSKAEREHGVTIDVSERLVMTSIHLI